MKTITTLFILLMLHACVSTSTVMDFWLNHHKSELYLDWGPPSQVTSDGNGGEILIYNTYVNMGQSPGVINNQGYGNYSYTEPINRGYNRIRMFYVNSNGIIYSWRSRGL